MHIEVYTDGSATTKDKPGGYGYVIVIDGKKHSEGSGHMDTGTNNDAELQAAIEGLSAIKELAKTTHPDGLLDYARTPNIVTLVSDSQIILGWADGSYAFRQENKIDKFKQLQFLVQTMHVRTRWVEGHTGDEHNERCDKLANAARLGKDVDAVKQRVKKIQTLGVTFRISADREMIDKITKASMAYADKVATVGSELWSTTVIDKFTELLDNKCFKVEQE